MLDLTGGKSTDMQIVEDIRIIIQGTTARIGGLTKRGMDWISVNLVKRPFETFIIDSEHVDDIKNLIQEDGLTYKEKE